MQSHMCQTTEISLHQSIDSCNGVEPETTTNLKQIPLIGDVTMPAEASFWLKTKRAVAHILITAIYSLFPIWQEKWAVIQDGWTVSGWWVDLSKPQPQLWSTPESPIGFHLIHPIWFAHTAEKWEILEEKRWMEYALIHLPHRFPPFSLHIQPPLNHVAVTLWLFPAAPPPSSSSLFASIFLLPSSLCAPCSCSISLSLPGCEWVMEF